MKLLPNKKNNLEYEFLPAALEITEVPPSPFGRIVLWLIVALISTALAWSYFGKIDEIAVARGQVTPDGNVKVVEAASGGVLSSLNVNEGDYVKKGQVLAKLDSTLATADLTSTQESLNIAKFQRDVEQEVLNGQDITATVNNADVPQDVKNDLLQLNDAKNSESSVKQDLLSLDVTSAQSQLSTEQNNLKTIQSNLSAAQAQQKQLEQDPNLALNSTEQSELQSLDTQIANLQTSLTAEQSRVASAQSAVDQAKGNLNDNNAQNTQTTESDVVQQDEKITSLEAQLSKDHEDVQLQSLTAPADGTILSISSNTLGGVIPSAQPFITIVPAGTPLLVDANVQNQDIGFISVGQRVAIKVDTYSYQQYGYLTGKVKSISPDAFNDQKLGEIYRIKVTIDSDKTDNNNTLRISSGMSVSAEIKTGQRRIINFFLDPLVNQTETGLKVR